MGLTILFLFLSLQLAIFVVAGRVLVIGASGRLGSQIVSKLIQLNMPVRTLVRNKLLLFARDSDKEGENQLVETCIGDVSNTTLLAEVMRDCDSVICVHGVKPLRFAKLSDLWISPAKDPNHPYNVNYIGTKNVLAAMKLNNVPKLVRVTGGLIGRGEFNLFKALFNLLLSFTVKWHEASEIAIRASGVDYTVLRPTELVLAPPAKDNNRTLILRNDGVLPRPGKISITDVAELCVESVVNPQLANCTAVCTTIAGSSGPQEWAPLVKQVLPRHSLP